MKIANFHIFMDLSTWPEWSLNCLISMKCVNCLLWCALQPPHFKPLALLREILLHLIKTIIPFGTILLHPFSVLLEDLKNQCQTTFKLLWRNMLVFFFSLTCHLSVSCILWMSLCKYASIYQVALLRRKPSIKLSTWIPECGAHLSTLSGAHAQNIWIFKLTSSWPLEWTGIPTGAKINHKQSTWVSLEALSGIL